MIGMGRSGRGLVALVAIPVLAGAVAPAFAGTKIQMNVVPASAVSPATNPTLTSKGKFQVDDKAKMLVTLKGVTDGGGAPVTTSTSFKDTGTLDGTQYVAVIRGTFTALGVSFESALPVELKKGNGTGKVSLAGLFGAIPPGTGRSVEVNGVEIWGPLGPGNVAACTAVVTAGFSVVPNDPACRGGTKIGVGGMNIP